MSIPIRNRQDQLIAALGSLWQDPQDQAYIAKTIQALDTRYDLGQKMAKEPEVEDIIKQMAGRLARSYARLADIQNKSILDIACGSNTSKLPASLHIKTPFGNVSLGGSRGYTALFEPWFCRILFELEAAPVGVEFGDLEQEVFITMSISGNQARWVFYPMPSLTASRTAASSVPPSSLPSSLTRLTARRLPVRSSGRNRDY
jgi:hypothetical protein